MRGYVDAATPAFIVTGAQEVGSGREIDGFTPRQLVPATQRNVYASAGFALQIQINIIKAAAVIYREQKSTLRQSPRQASSARVTTMGASETIIRTPVPTTRASKRCCREHRAGRREAHHSG